MWEAYHALAYCITESILCDRLAIAGHNVREKVYLFVMLDSLQCQELCVPENVQVDQAVHYALVPSPDDWHFIVGINLDSDPKTPAQEPDMLEPGVLCQKADLIIVQDEYLA